MIKPLLLLQTLLVNRLRYFSAALFILLLFGLSIKSQAQVYYITNDANKDTKSTTDALLKAGYKGENPVTIASGFTFSPTIVQVDLPNNRAFVYEAYSITPPTGLGIKVVNLNTGALITTIPVTLTGRIMSIKYDPLNDYIYYVVQDSAPTTTSANDALVRVKPDGSGSQTLISGFVKNPTFLALDIPNNRVFVYENLFADHGLVTITLSGNTATSSAIHPTVASAGGILGLDIDYDPATDYIYLLTSDNTGSNTPNDALYKIRPDGTGQVTIKSSLGNNLLYCMALDAGNNRAYFYDGISSDRAIDSVNLVTGNVGKVISVSNLPVNSVVAGLWAPKRAMLTTTAASNVSSSFATVGGNVTYTDVAVTERGVVYSSSNATPVIGTDNKVSSGSGKGTFSASITGLGAVTTYYVRAYAISSAGTAYGDVVTFSTISNNANLSAFAISAGTLSPAFDKATNVYTANVTYDKTSITLTPTAEEPHAIIKVNNNVVTSGTASGGLNLNPGSNTITTVVTAQDGTTTKTYTTTITKYKSPQIITFNTIPAVTYGGSDFTLAAIAGSTLPVTYTSDNNSVASVTSTGTVHIVGAGTVNITAAQAGNTTYLAATNVSQAITVNKAV